MSDLQVFSSISEFKNFRKTLKSNVGFVATMGALHQGHASLMKQASIENEFSVLSIYVNPTQFNNSTDLEKYPKTLEADLQIASECGVNSVILPVFSEIYADNYRYKLTETEFSKKLCGLNRPGHFDGVLTVVMKLLNIINPTKAYFGEKDFQQVQLIEDMVQSFFMDVQIIRSPTIRETSGLAMSSRNKRLSINGLKKAALIYDNLKNTESLDQVKKNLLSHNFEIDYVEEIKGRRFIAAILEGVRLIDNVKI